MHLYAHLIKVQRIQKQNGLKESLGIDFRLGVKGQACGDLTSYNFGLLNEIVKGILGTSHGHRDKLIRLWELKLSSSF